MRQNPVEISLLDLVNFIRRGIWFALLISIPIAAGTYFWTNSLDPSYRARATVLAAQTTLDSAPFGTTLVTAPPLDVDAYKAAALSDPVIAAALSNAGLGDGDPNSIASFRKRINVRTEQARTSSLINIDVTNTSPVIAAQLANGLAQALVDWDKNRSSQSLMQIISSLEQRIAARDEQIRSLQEAGASQDQIDGRINLRAQEQDQLSSARALSNSVVSLLSVIQPAAPPLSPEAPRPTFNAILTFVLGISFSYGYMLLRGALDMRLKSSDDLTKVSDLPVLAEFPKQASGQRHLPREAANYLRTNLLFATIDAQPKVILITSAGEGEGKSSVALSLAESFAQSDHHTLLIDADMRKPVLAKEYNLNFALNVPLNKYLEDLDQQFVPVRIPLNAEHHLDVIPSFAITSSPADLLSRGFRERLSQWSSLYDVIIIDSAPVLPVADTLTIAPMCTGVVLTVSLENAEQRNIRAPIEILKRIGAHILGLVATDLKEYRNGSKKYGYGYGYHVQDNIASAEVRIAKEPVR